MTPSTRPASPSAATRSVLVVGDAADIELVGDLGAGVDAATTPATGGPALTDEAGVDRDALRASLGRGMGIDPASAGIGTLALVALLSVAVTLARRHRAQRVLRRRIVARLEAIGRVRAGPGPGGAAGCTVTVCRRSAAGPPPRLASAAVRPPGPAPNGSRTRHARPTLGSCVGGSA